MPKGPERRTVRYTLRLSERLRSAIEAAAAADSRSASDWMVLALTEAVGLKPLPPRPAWLPKPAKLKKPGVAR